MPKGAVLNNTNDKHLKKWAALSLSFANVSFALMIMAFPITFMLGSFVISNFHVSYENRSVVQTFFLFLPVVLVAFRFYIISGQSAKELVKNELVSEGTATEIDTQLVSDDEINERIRNAFNDAREKLGMQTTPIVLMRSTENAFNAFALSSRKDNVIVVFDGLTKSVSDQKLQAVIGHELGHIKNKDSLQKIMLFSIQYFIPYAAVWSNRMVYSIHAFASKGRVWWITLSTMVVLMGFRFAMLFVRFSLWANNFINAYAFKQSEHLADHIGANASSKQDMIDVLRIIEESENNSDQKPSALYALLAEHPKTADRINFIQNIR